MKSKFFADHSRAAEQLLKDVGLNNVKTYDVADYQRVAQVPVHPPELTDKWTHVSVATSGEPVTGCEWLVVVPYRLDSSKSTNEKCYDIDPVLFVFQSNSGNPHPSGAVAYHQDFPDRTTPVPGYKESAIDKAVSELRTTITANSLTLAEGPPEVLSALSHMVGKFRSDFIGGNP